MSSDLIVNSPVLPQPRLITESIPQSIRALRGRAGVLKIDFLPNDPAPVFHRLALSGSEYEPKLRSLEWNKRDVAPRTRRAMFARIGAVTDFTASNYNHRVFRTRY